MTYKTADSVGAFYLYLITDQALERCTYALGARAEPIVVWHEIAHRHLLVSYVSKDNPDVAQRLKNNIQAGRFVAVRE